MLKLSYNLWTVKPPQFYPIKIYIIYVGGFASVGDEPRSGRPKHATTPETIEPLHDIVCETATLTKHEIADTTGILNEFSTPFYTLAS